MHEKISELATRVRELEDALRSSHAHMSSEHHPLLTDELLRIKAPLQREAPALRNANPVGVKEEDEHNPDVVDAFGTLSISLSGRAKYFGQIANSWVSLTNSPTIIAHNIFAVLPSGRSDLIKIGKSLIMT